jgi:fructokinase
MATASLGADGTADYAFDLDWRLPPLPDGTDTWVHAGSIAAVLPPDGVQVLEAVRRLRANYE